MTQFWKCLEVCICLSNEGCSSNWRNFEKAKKAFTNYSIYYDHPSNWW